MKPISVLFYIEPVCFRHDPLFLIPCIDWIARIVRMQPAGEISFGFASSPPLCRGLGEQIGVMPCRRFEINPRDILEPFAFDRHAYGRDLYARADSMKDNAPLIRFFQNIDQNFCPDVIITFSQNRYIESLFAHRRTLFWEMGPLPRQGDGYSFFIDPRSHELSNLLNSEIARIRTLPVSTTTTDTLSACWDRLVTAPAKAHPQAEKIAQWMDEARQGRSVALFAMQPPDWLTYEAGYDSVSPDTVMMRWLNDLPPDWIAIATYHVHFRLPAAAEAMLAEMFPAFKIFPSVLIEQAISPSEILLPHIDGVVAISSAVAMTGLLCGKSVIACGRSYLNGFCGNDLRQISTFKPLAKHERMALLMFLTNFYCHPVEDVLSTPGYFAKLIRRLVEAADPITPYFDFSDWSPSRLCKLLTGRDQDQR